MTQMQAQKPKPFFEKMTVWIGSIPSLIVHSFLFLGSFLTAYLGFVAWETMLLVLTTLVSLEAIYLSIFIQMTVNRHQKELEEVSEDVEDIQEDIEDISEDVEDLGKDVEDIQENLEELAGEDTTEEEHKKNQIEQLASDVKRVLTDLGKREDIKPKD